MMTLEYAVAGESLHGATSAGPQTIHLSVGHLQLARSTRVTRAAMSVSFDGGKTWHRANVTGHGGSYTATFRAPAGAKVSLRTSAADAAGGSIAETITNAYQIAS
jgi:Neuraminidase (sialidase)